MIESNHDSDIEVFLGGSESGSTGSEKVEKMISDIKSPNNPDDPFGMSLEKSAKYLTGIATGYSSNIRPSTGAGGTKSNSMPLEGSDVPTLYDYLDVMSPPQNPESLVRVYQKSIAHQSAIAAKVSNISQLGFNFVETQKVKDDLAGKKESSADNKKKALAKEKRDLHDWLENLNKNEDFEQAISNALVDYYATGNAYLEIVRTPNGVIGHINHVNSSTMRVRRPRDGFVQLVGSKVVFFRNFGEDTPDPFGHLKNPSEMVHLKEYSPISDYYGVPQIVVALNAVLGTELAMKYNLDYFENKAVPKYVIVLKGNISQEARVNLASFFDEQVKGENHRTVIVPLPPDGIDGSNKTSFEMKPLEGGIQEASFEKYIKMNNSAILMAHRVPITKVSVADGVNLAIARDADKTFKEQVCRPMQRRLEKVVNKIVKEKTENFLFKYNELSLTDEDTQSKIDERHAKNGILSIDEIRAKMAYPPVGEDSHEPDSAKGRERDSERSAGATDSAGEARNPKGEGRSYE